MPTIEERALALVKAILVERHYGPYAEGWFARDEDAASEALCRALEAHDAFARDVSDAVEADIKNYDGLHFPRLRRFIIPEPGDPLVAVMAFNSLDTATAEQRAANLREDAKAIGYEIKLVEVGDAD